MISAVFAFILSPVGRIAMIGLAVLAAYTYVDRKATYRERAKCEAAAMAAKLQAAENDLRAQQQATREAEEAMKESAAAAAQQKVRADNYAEELKKRPNASCSLTDDDLTGGVRVPVPNSRPANTPRPR